MDNEDHVAKARAAAGYAPPLSATLTSTDLAAEAAKHQLPKCSAEVAQAKTAAAQKSRAAPAMVPVMYPAFPYPAQAMPMMPFPPGAMPVPMVAVPPGVTPMFPATAMQPMTSPTGRSTKKSGATNHSTLSPEEKKRRKESHEAAVAAALGKTPVFPEKAVPAASTAAPTRKVATAKKPASTGRSKKADAANHSDLSPAETKRRKKLNEAAVAAATASPAPCLSLPQAVRKRAAADAALRAAEVEAEKAAEALREAEESLAVARRKQAAAESMAVQRRAKRRAEAMRENQRKYRERELKYGARRKRKDRELKYGKAWRKGARAGVMNPIWMRNYEKLKKRAEDTGSCDLPTGRRSDGTDLGRLYDWILKQRKLYRICLNASDPASQSGEKEDSNKDEEGKSKEEEGKNAERVEKALKSMTPAKVALLEALPGWQWSKKNPNAWREQFDALVRYKAEHGTLVVKDSPDSPDGLYSWVGLQRCNYRRMQEGKKTQMTVERSRLLESIGMVWDVTSDIWNKWFDALLDYKREYGTCHVPKKHKQLGMALGSWCQRQRRYYRDIQEGKMDAKKSILTPERMALLEQVGFPWVVEGARFKSKDAVTFESQMKDEDSDTESDNGDSDLQR